MLEKVTNKKRGKLRQTISVATDRGYQNNSQFLMYTHTNTDI